MRGYDHNKQPAKDEFKCLSVTDCARRAGVAISVVNEWFDSGRIKFVTGARPENRYVRITHLDEFLESQNVSCGTSEVTTERTMPDGSIIVAEHFDYGFFG